MGLVELLRKAVSLGGSDIFIIPGSGVMVKVNNTRQPLSDGKLMPAELAEYIGDHSDSFFVFATSEKKSGAAYLTPWKAPDTKAEKNVMGTGSWGTMSPYVLDKLGAYGLKNPIKDLIDNSNAYYIGNKRIGKLTEYYNKWYGGDGKTIRLEQVSESGGYKIWKVVSQDGEQQKTAT